VATDLEVKVNQQPIVRHYRGASRTDVEQAYRADARPAIRAGYQPVSHQWSQDPNGLLLAVSYALAQAPAVRPVQQPAPVAPQHSPTQVAPQQAPAPVPAPVAEQFVVQPPAESQWLPPAQQPPSQAQYAPQQQPARYQPPAEMYQPPRDMYAPPAQPVRPQAQYPESQEQYAAQPQYAPQQQYQQPVQPQYQQPAPPTVIQPEAQPVQPAQAAQPVPSAPAADSRSARLTIQTMDLHCAGEPLRIIRSGFPEVPSLPVLERRRWVMENADQVRRAIIQEPRGHRDMYGAILLPPFNDYADMCVLFMHNEGYSTMCGHGIIAITTGLIEEGLYPASEPVTTIRYEVPAGIVAANAATVQLEDGSWAVRGVRFTNVPSYLAAQSLPVRPDGVQLFGPSAQYGALSVDIAFGGAYYGIVNAADLGIRVVPEQAEELRRAGAAITDVLRRDHTPQHPTDAALGFVYGTIIVDMDPRTSPDGRATDAHLRNVTIFADAEVDRSPCGSGTSALLAQLHARGRMRVGQEIVNAGITGEHFLGRIEAETSLGPYRAVSTSVAGTAYITGYSTFVVDSRDPLGDGFLLGKAKSSSAY
jgi:trans-L-3-hydroxyproline dehydratase